MQPGDDSAFVERVLAAVRGRQPAGVALTWGEYVAAAPSARALDADGHLIVTCGKRRVRYAVALKPRPLHGADVPRLLALKQARGASRLLVLAEAVSHAQAERLSQGGVEFVDGAGNVHLHLPTLVWLTTGMRSKGQPRAPDRARLFRVAGVKLLYLFLGDLCRAGLQPERRYLNRPYREMVAAAGIAFGSVSTLMRELEANRYLMASPDAGEGDDAAGTAVAGRSLDRVPELAERWVRAYGDVLRPKLVLGRYRAPKPDWWRSAALDCGVGLWGGETAAAKLTNQLKLGVVTIYRQGHLAPWLLAQGLASDPAGTVEVLDAFWHDPDMREGDCVLPLLAYADLLAGDDERNLEVARVLYESRIRPCVEAR
ncbi:MAG: hypothetical protein GX595_02385 [Lentisphaerae bacterium]|nr:hypothetical protein [Lentisphaerota bacterium]